MPGISLRTDSFDHIFGSRGDIERRATKAMKQTLNRLAFENMQYLRAKSRTELETRKSFFRTGIQYQSAGSNLQSKVGILERIDLAEQMVLGGERKPKRAQMIAIPVGAKKRPKPISFRGKPGVFTERTDSGALILFKRTARGRAKPLYVFKPKTDYTEAPYFNFEAHVNHILATFDFERHFWTAFRV